MRKSGFYPRLALVNLLRNRQFYLPYLLSCSGTAAMYYIVNYLSRSQIIAGVRGAPYLQTLMMLGTIVVALFSIVLMLYANSFVMKRRRRELGLYNVLGMEKRHIAHLMLWETLLCALASKRAHDINDMMRGQRDRAIQLQTAVEIARAADKKPLTIAFNEVSRGDISYDPETIDIHNH